MRFGARARRAALLVGLAGVLGCGGGESEPSGDGAERGSPHAGGQALPPGHPTVTPTEAIETGAELPLKLEGIGSKAELDRALAKLPDDDTKALFEAGFRGCFVRDRSKREYTTAMTNMPQVLEAVPRFAPAYRVLAYARLNISFDMEGATELYEKAVAADPDYGEAHYALSFMLTQFDMDRGREHFERAMELGVPDERDLGLKFYGEKSGT